MNHYCFIDSARRIVVLGKTGDGKSLTNILRGEPAFNIDHYASSGTRECQSKIISISGKNILFIDTPGFFDTDRSEQDMKSEIVRCITECAPGPHVFLIVLKVEKFADHEKGVIDKMNQCFSDEAFRFATVLFTHGDQLPEGMKIEEFVKQNNNLSDLIKKCGDRCHVIDNKYWKNNQGHEYRNKQYQLAELLKKINTIIDANRGGYFTNEMLQEVKRDIQQEEGRIKRSFPDITKEETATKAKNAVFDMLLKAAGVKTGALLGSFLGGETKLMKEEISVGSAAAAAEVKGILPDTATTWEQDKQLTFNHYCLIVPQRRIVLLGKSSDGKSSTANTLCGEPVFKVDHRAKFECQSEYMNIGGRTISFINTPGFFHTDRPGHEMKSEILRCITECAPGPHVFLIVLMIGKYTEHQKGVIDKINQYFSDEVFRFATVLFTHGDQLPEGMKIEEFVNESEALSDLIKKCGSRCHVIDNKYWKNNQGDEYRNNQYQVAELLKTIDKIIEANKGGCFTNEMLQKVKRDIQQEEGRIKQSSPDLTEVRCLIL
ncbi:uncharacterized protein LOC113014127 [Astatotilapia calliptera]|uniref:uncharacterized protein LOC113014127 n=1 Tax=Astatotilapia calliptera TaxID=8154 RepID=UPI000E41EED5|nr:uncharacterized protein LOC113014127 [Astatotilapia calliptera]